MSTTVTPLAVARLVAAAARGVGGVVDLHSGRAGEVATYGPDGRQAGVKVRGGDRLHVSVHVVARFGERLDDVADAVRQAVIAALARSDQQRGDATVDVHIADVAGSAVEGGRLEP